MSTSLNTEPREPLVFSGFLLLLFPAFAPFHHLSYQVRGNGIRVLLFLPRNADMVRVPHGRSEEFYLHW